MGNKITFLGMLNAVIWKLTCKGTCGRCLSVWGPREKGGERVELERGGVGQQSTKLGRKYQNKWLYFQSLNSDNHLPPSLFTGQFFLDDDILHSPWWNLSNKWKIFGSETEGKEVKPLLYCWYLFAFLPAMHFIAQHFSVCRFENNILHLPAGWSGLWRLASSAQPDPGSPAHPSPASKNLETRCARLQND